jgi:hypothetical protein
MRAFNRENWEAANDQLSYFLKVLADDGYPDELIADVIMASGVLLIDRVCGRDVLVRHLSRLLLTAFDPKADMSTGPGFLQMMGHSTRLEVYEAAWRYRSPTALLAKRCRRRAQVCRQFVLRQRRLPRDIFQALWDVAQPTSFQPRAFIHSGPSR